jgi:hypothetical protein
MIWNFDLALIHSVVLGDQLDNIQLGNNNARTLSVYKEYFEISFLQESKEFYMREAAKFTSADSISEYLKQVNCSVSV